MYLCIMYHVYVPYTYIMYHVYVQGISRVHNAYIYVTKLAGTSFYHNHFFGETTWQRPVTLDEALLGNESRGGGDYTNLTA